MNHSLLSVLADAASDALHTKKRVASNRVLSTCAKCNSLWPTALALENHAKKARHEAWVCSVAGCGVGFKNRSAFSKHKSRHNNPAREYPCQECGHVFPRRDNLFEHQAIQGRCKPLKSHEVAQCSPDRSKRKRLNNQIQPLSTPESLDDSFPTGIVTSHQPQLLSSIEHFDHSWPQLPVEPAIDSSSCVSSINHLQAWQHTYMPVDDQSSTGHFERPSLGAETSKADDQFRYLALRRIGAYSSSGHLHLQRIDKDTDSGTTNNVVLCEDVDHAGAETPNDHSVLPHNVNNVVTVSTLPSHDPIEEDILSSDRSASNVDLSPAESGVIESQRDPPWLKWLRNWREGIKSRNGAYLDLDIGHPLLATRLQVILEMALLYYRDHLQDLYDIMSNLSIAILLAQEGKWEYVFIGDAMDVYYKLHKAIEECHAALIPDAPTLFSFFGRDMAVGTGPHRALWSLAVRLGQNEIVGLLLGQGAHPDQEVLGTSTSDRIPLVVACDDRNWDLTTVLLKAGANPNVVCNDDEESVLSIAVREDKLEVVKLLLEKKANPNFNSESTNHIPLLEAIGKGYTDVVELLLQQGADENMESHDFSATDDKFGSHCTPLLLATTKEDIGMVNLLIKNGANLDGQNAHYIPLLVAVGMGCTEIVELLLDKGADVNLKGWDVAFEYGEAQCTPLIYAIHEGHDRITGLLLEKGAEPSLSCQNEYDYYFCPLLMAIGRGRTDVIELLLEKGADINMIGADWAFDDGESKCTPLMFATSEGHYGVVKLLLEQGADPNKRCDDGRFRPLLMAIRNDWIDIVELLLDNGANVNMEGSDYGFYDGELMCTPLILASHQGLIGMVKSLLRRGADPNPNFDMEDGKHLSPLIEAACHGHTEIVKLLLDNGAHVNALTLAPSCDIEDKQQTPLYAAISEAWYMQSVKHGHLIGETHLRAAVRQRRWDVVQLLLAKNARVEPGIEKEMVGHKHEDGYHIVLKLIEEARLRQALS